MNFFAKTPLKKKIIYKICDFLILIFRDQELAGWIVAYLHTLVYGIFWFFVVTEKITYTMIGIILFTLFINIYFNGCLIFKVERKLFNNNNWFGIWGLCEFIYLEPNKKNTEFLFSTWLYIMLAYTAVKFYIQSSYSSISSSSSSVSSSSVQHVPQ